MVASQNRSATYWDVSAATAAAVTLWLVPIFAELDSRTKLIANSLALGASLYGCHQCGELNRSIKARKLQESIGLGLAEELVDLEFDRRVALLRQQYGQQPVVEQPPIELMPEVEPEWEPVNPFELPAGDAGLLIGTLNDYGIQSKYVGQIEGPAFNRHIVKPGFKVDSKGKQTAVKVSAVAELADEIQIALKLPEQPLISVVESGVAIDIPRKDRQVVKYADYIQPSRESGPGDPVKVAIGVDLQGQLIELDLADPDNCHMGIGGTTGAGKSGLLRSMIYSVIDRYPPTLAKLAIFSEKASEYPDLNVGNPWMIKPLMADPNLLIEFLKTEAVPEMEGRDEICEQAKVKDIDAYNKLNPDAPLPHWIIMVDGYGEVIAQLEQGGDKKLRKELETLLIRLAQRARSVGIHLIIGTQRIDGKLLNPQLLSNLPVRICLKVRSKRDSELVCGENGIGGERLLGKGDLLLLRAGKVERLQSPFVEPAKIEEFRRQYEGYQFDSVQSPKPQAEPEAEEPIRNSRFSSEYQTYLKSEFWQQRRDRIKPKHCGGCHTTEGLQLHHRIYPAWGAKLEDFINQPDDEFTWLCEPCHKALTKSIRNRRKQ